jgi:RNA polymerase sigma factor (TIGR02999 family)
MVSRDPSASDEPTSDDYLTPLADGRAVTSAELAGLVYDDLHRMASTLFRRESRALTLQPTALVHEAFLRLADQQVEDGWRNRAHFLAIAARSMRRVLADAARERKRLKRGDGADRVTLTGNDPEGPPLDLDLVDLDEALDGLAQVKQRYARVVELRYFAGLTIPEVAEVLGVSPTIVDREWAKARAWLAVKLEGLDG